METLNIAQLKIEVHGYEFPDGADYFDANWLVVTVSYVSNTASIKFHDPCIMASDLLSFRDEIIEMYSGDAETAELASHEPNLNVQLRKNDLLGAIKASLELRPDAGEDVHILTMQLDQSYLPGMQREIDEILRRYPMRPGV
jgi:hypothetical protein